MKIILSLLIFFGLSFGSDATIEVIKKVESLPTISVEDSSISYNDTFKLKFFKALVADLNVISIFNVDRHHWTNYFNNTIVNINNKDKDYVLRYMMSEDDEASLNVEMKLISHDEIVLLKRYKVRDKKKYIFVAHTMAYDLNEFMGLPSVEWMKRKVIFSKMTTPKRSEIVIADYTLEYQHVVVKSGFNIFPKWANKAQTGFYYTSLGGKKPTLRHIDMKNGINETLLSSDGMLVCSDVSDNSKKLLLTMAPKGQPDVYMYDTDKRKYKKITKFSGIDVNGQFMGSDSVVFISNRLGYPNVFSKSIKTGEVEQMVYYGKSNSSCSVNGEYIVYKARESSSAFSKNTFNLHLISTKTDFIRRLTAIGVNEFPRFSKDGDAILFIKNYKSQSSLGVIRLNHNKNYLFPLKSGKIQSMDW